MFPNAVLLVLTVGFMLIGSVALAKRDRNHPRPSLKETAYE